MLSARCRLGLGRRLEWARTAWSSSTGTAVQQLHGVSTRSCPSMAYRERWRQQSGVWCLRQSCQWLHSSEALTLPHDKGFHQGCSHYASSWYSGQEFGDSTLDSPVALQAAPFSRFASSNSKIATSGASLPDPSCHGEARSMVMAARRSGCSLLLTRWTVDGLASRHVGLMAWLACRPPFPPNRATS